MNWKVLLLIIVCVGLYFGKNILTLSGKSTNILEFKKILSSTPRCKQCTNQKLFDEKCINAILELFSLDKIYKNFKEREYENSSHDNTTNNQPNILPVHSSPTNNSNSQNLSQIQGPSTLPVLENPPSPIISPVTPNPSVVSSSLNLPCRRSKRTRLDLEDSAMAGLRTS